MIGQRQDLSRRAGAGEASATILSFIKPGAIIMHISLFTSDATLLSLIRNQGRNWLDAFYALHVLMQGIPRSGLYFMLMPLTLPESALLARNARGLVKMVP